MKTIQKFLLTGLLLAVPLIITAQDQSKGNETVKFITSIDCANCVNKIMNNIPHEKGVKDVKCDLETKEIAITYRKNRNNPEQLQKAIEKLGFTAKPVKEEETGEKKGEQRDQGVAVLK